MKRLEVLVVVGVFPFSRTGLVSNRFQFRGKVSAILFEGVFLISRLLMRTFPGSTVGCVETDLQ